MKIIYCNFFPPKKFWAINVLGLIVARKGYGTLNDAEINHERIHTRQMLEMLILLFYITYVIEWIIRLVQYKDKMLAYQNISFEREAYSHMYDPNYLKTRKWFSFLKYYKTKKS